MGTRWLQNCGCFVVFGLKVHFSICFLLRKVADFSVVGYFCSSILNIYRYEQVQ